MLGAVLASAAVDVPWSRQIDGDAAGDAAMPRQGGTTGDNEYDALGGDAPA